jgi:3-methyladenine DNA glycosylase AlkC
MSYDYRRELLFERMEQRLLEIMADYLDDEELQVDKSMANISDPVSREESELHIRMAKAAMEEVKKTFK